MIRLDEDSLICDLAQSYSIYDYKSYNPSYIAVLACGLSDDSRIKSKMLGIKCGLSDYLLALAVDRLGLLIWAQTEDGQKNRNRPPSIAESLLIKEETDADDLTVFYTAADFNAAREKLLKGLENGN